MYEQFRKQWSTRQGRTWLGVALSAAVLIPGFIILNSAPAVDSPDHVEESTPALMPNPVDLGDEIDPDLEPGAWAESESTPDTLFADANPQPVAAIAPTIDVGDEIRARANAVEESPPLPFYLTGGPHSNFDTAIAPILEGLHDCIIEPHEVIDVGSALTAVVASIKVERSDIVKIGQVLAELESSPERAAVAVAQARAKMEGEILASRARMELGWRKKNRADQLFESNALSADIRDEVGTEAKVANAVLTEARERKKLMELEHLEAVERLVEHTIRSPVTGVVVDRLKSPGEVVKEETILVIAQIDPLQVEVILPAAAFGFVRPGLRAEVSLEIPNAGVQVASVSMVDPVVDGTSGTFSVRLKLPNPDYSVPSGLRCQLRFLQAD
jgi:RND family efflux transporter MFP subunit